MLCNQEYEKTIYLPPPPKLDAHTFKDVFVDVELEIDQELETVLVGWLAGWMLHPTVGWMLHPTVAERSQNT